MADDLKTILGFEARDALATLAKMEIALKGYSNAMATAATATKKYNQIARHAAGQMRKVSSGFEAAAETQRKVTKQVETTTKRTTNAVTKAGKKTKEASTSMVLSWQSVIRIFAIQVVHQMVSKFTSALSESVVAAREFEIAIAEIQTIAPEFRADLDALSNAVHEFSDMTGEPLAGVAEGVYQTLSNQVTDAAGSFKFMSTAHAFATAAATDTASSVNLLSSVINSYNMDASEAAEVGGKLAKTIELGRIRGEEFANTFGRITTLSAQLGISLDEVLTSITVLTVSGMKWNEAFTLVSNVQLKLIRPTDKLKERFAELGVATAEAGIQAYGFQGFLAKITEESGASASALGETFNRVRAIRGALGLTNENAEKYVKNLEAIRAAGEKELFERKEIVFKTNAKQIEIELNKIQNLLVEDLGRGLNDILKAFIDTFGGGVEAVKAFGTALSVTLGIYIAWKVAAIAQASQLGLAFTGATGAAAKLKIALMALWKSPAILAIAAGAAVLLYISYLNRLKAAAEKLRAALEAEREYQLESRLRQIRVEAKAEQLKDQEILAAVQRHLQAEVVAEQDTVNKIKRIREAALSNLLSQLNKKATAASNYYQGLENAAKSAENKIKGLNQEITAIRFDISDFRFDRAAKDMDPLRQSYLKIQRSVELRRQAISAINRGEKELAATYNARAVATAKSALQAADESGNRTQIRKAENEVLLAMENQVSTLEHRKKVTKDQVTQIEAVIGKLGIQREIIQVLNKEFGDLVSEMKKAEFDPIKIEKIRKKMHIVAREMGDILGKIPIDFKIAEDFDLIGPVNTILDGIRDPGVGKKNTITFAIDATIDKFLGKMTEVTTATTEAGRLIEDLVGVGAKGEQQQRVVELGKQLAKTDKIKQEQVKTEATIVSEIMKQYTLVDKLKQAHLDTFTILQKIKLTEGSRRARVEALQPFEESARQYVEAAKLYQQLQTEVGKPILDETTIITLKSQLGELRATAGEVGQAEVAATIQEMLTSIDAIIEGKQKLRELSQQETGLTIQETEATRAKYGDLKKAIEEEKIIREKANETLKEVGAAAKIGASAAVSAEETIQAALRQTTRLAKERNAAMIGNDGATAVGKAFGGFIPSGTDTVPAMLSPGEFVVNARSSRKFFSQLVAMNSGVRPQYHADGGAVSNIGDINITVNEAAGAKQTAREIMSAFRRETRKQTARI